MQAVYPLRLTHRLVAVVGLSKAVEQLPDQLVGLAIEAWLLRVVVASLHLGQIASVVPLVDL